MSPSPWFGRYRLRSFRPFLPWFLLLGGFFFVRLSKGAGFLDAYAFLAKPFWPGSAQKDWIQGSVQLEQLNRIKLLEIDNQRLRQILQISKSSKSDLVSAAVISRRLNGWWQQLELGKGSVHGVEVGNAVIGPGGLIGIINSVIPTTSRVRLLTAPGSQVGVWVPRTKRHAILTGVGTNRPLLKFLDKEPKVRIGDVVSTSPASTLLPANLNVGIIQFLNPKALPAPEATVQLTASPEAIDWVQIQIR